MNTEITITETDLPLDEIFAVALKALQDVRTSGVQLLHRALDAGDALNAAEELVRRNGGGWKRQLRDHCFLSVRSAFVYQQLARRRPEIEEAIVGDGLTSLRGALRLISKPKEQTDGDGSDHDHGVDGAAAGDGGAGDGGAGRHAADGAGDGDGAGDQSGRAHIDHADGGGQPASDEPAGAPAPAEPAPANVPTAAPPKTKTKPKPSLVESWESSPEDHAAIRDLVLEDHYALADGRYILSRIRAASKQHTRVITDLLDALGVDGMLQAMSDEFGRQLRDRVSTPKTKPTKPEFKTMQMRKTASGEFSVPPHGKRPVTH